MRVESKVTSSIRSAGTHLYTCVERGPVRVKRLARPELESRPLDPEFSSLTMRLPCSLTVHAMLEKFENASFQAYCAH